MIRATAELQFQLSQRNIQAMLRQLQSQLNVPLNINTGGAQRDINAVGDSLRRSTGFATNFGLAVGDSARRFAAYGAGVAIIAKIAFAFKSAASELLKFDKDMTTLSQVTGKTKDNLAAISKEILNLSVRTGISAGKLGELTVTLSQAGLKGKDLSNALDVIAASDLAPSFENMEDSVEGLIAIMQQFKKPSTEFRRQFGFINELSKEFAIESADIIEGVKRAGSVFESAGASLEEFASIMTIVRSTTRESAESIATGLKTITERIQRPEIIDYLEELGVELRDVEGKFVGPLKAFENLSAALSKRGSLSKGSLELIAVAKEIGGGRNLTKIIPILNSAAKAQKILEDASKKAADSLAKDEAVALKSVSKQLDILRADFVKFIHEVSVSDEFKNMAKSALGFAKAMVEVLKATKPFIPLIAQLGVLFGARSIVRGFTGAASPKFSGMRDDLPGLATGGAIDGVVKGPGSGTSDDVYARLSNGEFVIKASSVSKIGRNRLQYLNTRGEMPAFARGGSVGGEPVSAFGGITSPLISVAVFAALSKAMTGLKEDTESSSGTFDKFKESILPVIPAGILLYQGFKVTRTQLDLMAKSIKNVNGAVNGFTTWMNDAPRRAYERERTGNLEDAQIANNGAPLNRRQMKLADPTTNRVLAAGGTVGEAAVARRAFGRSLNSRVVGEGGNYELAQRRAREAATNSRYQNVVNNVGTARDNLSAARQLRAGTASSVRGLAASGSIGFAGMTQAEVRDITNSGSSVAGSTGRRERNRVIRRNQGVVRSANLEIDAARDRIQANPASRRELDNARIAHVRGLATMTPTQTAASAANIGSLQTQVDNKTADIALIRSRRSLIASTNESVDALRLLNRLDARLATATTAQTNAANARANVGADIAQFDAGIQTRPNSIGRRFRRAGQDFSAANERFGGAAAGITAAGIAGAAALSSASIAASRKNAEEAITSGSSGTAYSETLNASREERNQSSIITAGGIGGTIGSIFGPLGTAIGGVTGALIGMTGAVEFVTSWFTGIDPEEKSRQEAKDARRASEVNAVNKIMNDGVTKFGNQMRVADSVRISDGPEAAARKRGYEAQARMSLAETATSAVARVKSGDANTTDAMDGYKTLQAQLANEFATLADETLSKGGTFDDVKRKAPELVAALSMLTQEIGDPNLSTALMEQVESIKKGSDLFKKESLLRSVALNELNNAVLYQKRVNASLQALASETRSISMSGDSAALRGQAISGDLSSQPIKEFGISLSEISTQLTADFHETLNAVGSFSQELQSQATAYKNILAASEQFSQDLPKILTDNLDPADIKTSGKKAIRQAYGGLGETKVTDIQKQFETLITDQESSGASADVKARQIDDFIKAINQQVGGALLDDLEKGRSERQARVAAIADTLEKEASVRTAALDKQIEANNALDNFTQGFVKSTSDSVAAARRGRTDRILKTIGGSTTGNDAADFTSLTNSRNAKVEQIDRLNASSKIGVITDEEVKRKAKLVEEVNVLGRALSELTDVSEDVTKAQEALAKLEDKQSKLKGKASELAFGGNDARQGFARSLVAQKFVSSGGNLQDLPEQLRSELFSFLQEFGDAKVFNGQSGTDIINTQTSKFLQSLGYSNDQVASLMMDMKPIEQKQLDALLAIATNTANNTVNNVGAVSLPQSSRGGESRGADTIPAMVAPGEFIVSADNAKKNKGLLHSINNGTVYASKGGWIGPDGKLYTEDDGRAMSQHTRSANDYYAATAFNSPDAGVLWQKNLADRDILRKRGLWNETTNTPIALTYVDSPSKSTKTSEDFTGPKDIRSQQHQDILNIKEQALAGPKFNEAVSSEGNEKLIDIQKRGVDSRRGLAAEREAEKEKLYFSRGIAGSSSEAAEFARENRSLSSGSSQIDRALDSQSNGYNTLLASMEGRITPAEKELLAQKGLKSRAALVTDRTGLSARFKAGGALEKYYESGKSFDEIEREEARNSTDVGIAGNAAMAEARAMDLKKSAEVKAKNRARLANYVPTDKDIKKDEIRNRAKASAQAAKDLAKLGPNAVARSARDQDLAEIRTKKSSVSTPKYTQDEIRAIQEKRAIRPKSDTRKKRGVNRLSSADPKENSNPITPNDQIITSDMLKSQLMRMVSEESIKGTRSFLKVGDDLDDSQFREAYAGVVENTGSKYQRVIDTLFGVNGGKVEGNRSQGLFSGARYRNGIFSSGILNQEYLKDNAEKVREIQQTLFELGNTGDTTDTTEQILNRMTKNGFGKSMRNMQQAVAQALTGTKPITEFTGPVQQTRAEQAVQQAQIPMPVQPAGTDNERAQIEWERLPVKVQQAIINNNTEIDKRNAMMDQENAKKMQEMERFNAAQGESEAIRVNAMRRTMGEAGNRQAAKAKEDERIALAASAEQATRGTYLDPEVQRQIAEQRKYQEGYFGTASHLANFYDGGIVGGKGGRDNNVVRASRGEGIVKTSTMNKIGSKGFEQLNKTGSLPQEELKSSVDMLMKTPTWMADFTSAVKALAGTSIKAELAPVSVNVRINGAEVLASLNADMKNLIKREVVTAVSNMYHDNSGKHMIRGMA